jgi:UDP-galactopyranose mutase
MLSADYVVVGSGLTGATIARLIADSGREVIVVERRRHVGGNVFDSVHPSGVRIHMYGPHYFRTGSDGIWSFVRRFSEFYRYEARVLTYVDGRHQNWPIQSKYLADLVGPNWSPAFHGCAQTFEEAALSLMPAIVYEKFVKGYTEKQWGVPARALEPGLAKRFDVRLDNDTRLSRHKYQGLPVDGYAAWMTRMLAGIPVLLNTDYLQDRAAIRARRLLIFTGPIDEFFRFELGRLEYRGQMRRQRYFPDKDYRLPGVQVNYPDPRHGSHIRQIEWKHLMRPGTIGGVVGTVTTDETPFSPSDPNEYEYPFPDEANQVLYGKYFKAAARLDRVLICGRLGEYRYYDMDQAIGRAMRIARSVLGRRSASVACFSSALAG